MVNKKKLKIIDKFEKKHKKIYGDCGETDCCLVENEIFRVADRKDWLGDDENYAKSIKEQKYKDRYLRCYVCEFIKEIRRENGKKTNN